MANQVVIVLSSVLLLGTLSCANLGEARGKRVLPPFRFSFKVVTTKLPPLQSSTITTQITSSPQTTTTSAEPVTPKTSTQKLIVLKPVNMEKKKKKTLAIQKAVFKYPVAVFCPHERKLAARCKTAKELKDYKPFNSGSQSYGLLGRTSHNRARGNAGFQSARRSGQNQRGRPNGG